MNRNELINYISQMSNLYIDQVQQSLIRQGDVEPTDSAMSEGMVMMSTYIMEVLKILFECEVE